MKTNLLKFLLEILIIFIGITLSFLFDEYRDDRKNAQARKEIVSSLLNDVEIKNNELNQDILSVRNSINSIDTCLYFSQIGKEIPGDEIDELIWSLSYDQGGFSTTTPSYIGLSSSGIWQQLPDTLRREIFELYNTNYSYVENAILKSYEYVSFLKTHYFTANHFNFYNATTSNVKLESRENSYVDQMRKSLKDPEFRSAILVVRNERTKIIRYQLLAIEGSTKLIAHLRGYLQKMG